MKTLSIILFGAILFSACNTPHTPREMSAMEVMGQLKNDFAVLIDIREKADVKELAESAHWIPLSIIKQNSNSVEKVLDESMSNKLIVTYGKNSADAKTACEIIIKSKKECNYLSGFSDWKINNLPIRLISTP